MSQRRVLQLTMNGGAGLAGLTLLVLLLQALLWGLGDEIGSRAAWLVARWTGIGALLMQILLVNLLALRSLAVKIET